MRITFTATEGGFEADEYALICGVYGGEHYLTFQRNAAGGPDDWGVHLEYGDQANGEYDRVAACRLTADRLSVDLSGPLGSLAGVTGFDVDLSLEAGVVDQLRNGLRSIFRGQEGSLRIA